MKKKWNWMKIRRKVKKEEFIWKHEFIPFYYELQMYRLDSLCVRHKNERNFKSAAWAFQQSNIWNQPLKKPKSDKIICSLFLEWNKFFPSFKEENCQVTRGKLTICFLFLKEDNKILLVQLDRNNFRIFSVLSEENLFVNFSNVFKFWDPMSVRSKISWDIQNQRPPIKDSLETKLIWANGAHIGAIIGISDPINCYYDILQFNVNHASVF